MENIEHRTSNAEHRMDAIQAAVERMPQADLPLTHRFTPGMYIRTIFMPKGALVVSKIHRTQHPFVVTRGRCSVWDGQVAPAQSNGVREIKAGHIGITMPGTRRILYIHEDTEWTTFHATDKTTPEAVEADIIEPHDFDREEALAHFARISGLMDKWMSGVPTQQPLVATMQTAENPEGVEITQPRVADSERLPWVKDHQVSINPERVESISRSPNPAAATETLTKSEPPMTSESPIKSETPYLVSHGDKGPCLVNRKS